MYETAYTIAQLIVVSGPAAWLATGVWDNLVYPRNNEIFTAQVMSLERMRETYPEEYARVSHRAITSRRIQQAAFRLVVSVELLATVLLWTAVIATGLSLIGVVATDTARGLALAGTAVFTSVWMGFLVVGNYFCYWFCHEEGQNTHFQMTLWGLGTLIFVALG
ncbi:MAG: DUF2165 family protein [Pseudomonadota bacterium]